MPRALPGEVVQEVVVAVNARARVGKTRRAKTGEGRAGEGYLRQAEIARIHFVRYRTQARVQHDRSLRVAEHRTILGEKILVEAVEAETRLIDRVAGNDADQADGDHMDIRWHEGIRVRYIVTARGAQRDALFASPVKVPPRQRFFWAEAVVHFGDYAVQVVTRSVAAYVVGSARGGPGKVRHRPGQIPTRAFPVRMAEVI